MEMQILCRIWELVHPLTSNHLKQKKLFLITLFTVKILSINYIQLPLINAYNATDLWNASNVPQVIIWLVIIWEQLMILILQNTLLSVDHAIKVVSVTKPVTPAQHVKLTTKLGIKIWTIWPVNLVEKLTEMPISNIVKLVSGISIFNNPFVLLAWIDQLMMFQMFLLLIKDIISNWLMEPPLFWYLNYVNLVLISYH